MSKQWAQAGVFGIIALSFLLPFVNVSCAAGEEELRGFMRALTIQEDDEDLPSQEFTGWELASGRGRLIEGLEDFPSEDESPPDVAEEFRLPAEPWAQIALGAALVGIATAWLRAPLRRHRAGALAAIVVAASLWLLLTSPSLRKLGVLTIDPAVGYWIALGTSLATGGWLAWEWRNDMEGAGAAGEAPVERSFT